MAASLVGAVFFYAEPSAFDAGNVSSDKSYGLTKSETQLKSRLDSLDSKNAQTRTDLEQLSERIEGVQSTLEGVNSQYIGSNAKINQMETELQKINEDLQKLNENLKANEADNKQIKQALKELSELITSYYNKELEDDNGSSSNGVSVGAVALNGNAISNTASVGVLNSNVGANSTNATTAKNSQNSTNLATNSQNLDKNATTSANAKTTNAWKKKDNAEILKLAINQTNAKKPDFTAAKEKFEHLIAAKYKPARSHFYLGEIEYKQQNYAGAIVFYQKSVAIYSQSTDYMPKLLYHTGISFDKVGDTKRANGFYNALKEQYPDTPEAKASPSR